MKEISAPLSNHMQGQRLPTISLPSTEGCEVSIADLSGWSVIFIYPRSSSPNELAPAGLSEVPGSKGCTPQARGFRDSYDQLRKLGVSNVYGLSTQTVTYQTELVSRLQLNYPILSDPDCRLAAALGLKTFTVDHQKFYTRTTLLFKDGFVRKVFNDIQDTSANALEVLGWMRENAGYTSEPGG